MSLFGKMFLKKLLQEKMILYFNENSSNCILIQYSEFLKTGSQISELLKTGSLYSELLKTGSQHTTAQNWITDF